MAQDDSAADIAHAVRPPASAMSVCGGAAPIPQAPWSFPSVWPTKICSTSHSVTCRSPSTANIQRRSPASPEFRNGVARALLVEATTRYGPADLALAVATRPDRLGEWDWAKWLPHLRWHGGISLLSLEPELRRWVEVIATTNRTTLLVIDDASLWSRNDSPFRDLIASPPPNLLVLALADRVERAPAATSSIISQDSNQRCRLRQRRALACRCCPPSWRSTWPPMWLGRWPRCATPNSPPIPGSARQTTSGLTLAQAFDLAAGGRTAPPAATGTPDEPLDVALGATLDGRPMRLSWKQGTMWSVAGPDPDDVATTVLAILLSVAVDRAPDRTPILLVSPEGSPIVEVVTRLPHFAGRADPDDTDASRADDVAARPPARRGRRRGRRGRIVRGRRPALRFPARAPRPRLAVPRIVHPRREVGGRFGSAVDPAPRRRRDRRSGDRRRSAITRNSPASPRAPTGPCSRRSSRSRCAPGSATARCRCVRSSSGDRSRRSNVDSNACHADRIVRLRRAHRVSDRLDRPRPPDRHPAPQLVPTPLPGIVVLHELLESNEADGVPIGLADDPTHGHHDVVWWQPGSEGSMLFVGTARAGLDVVVSTLTVGIGERFAPSDLEVYAIDGSSRRLAALQRLPHTKAGAPLDRLDRAAEIIDLVAGEVVARRSPQGHDGPDDAGPRPNVLLIIGDLTQLGRRLRESSLAGALDRLVTAANGAAVGVNVVAIASRLPTPAGWPTSSIRSSWERCRPPPTRAPDRARPRFPPQRAWSSAVTLRRGNSSTGQPASAPIPQPGPWRHEPAAESAWRRHRSRVHADHHPRPWC